MENVLLGKTGLQVSKMGLGGIPVQRITPEKTKELLKAMAAKGINYIDTARGYTVSEEYLGQALEGIRDQFVLATKSMARTREAMAADIETSLRNLLMCDKEAIEVQKILPFLSDTWPLCRIGRAVIRASQSCRQSCNKSQCPACGCRSHHSCTHAPQFSRSFPAREWGSVLQRQGACGQCP